MIKKSAVYLESKLSPVKIPAQIQKAFFLSKIALYKKCRVSVQHSISGTSGVDIRERILTMKVEINRIVASMALASERNFFARRKKEYMVIQVTVVSASLITNTFLPNNVVKILIR